VHVRLDVPRRVQRHHGPHGRNVEPARGDVGRDQRVRVALFERRQRPLPRRLRVEGPREATDVGVESKGVRSGVERRRGVSGLGGEMRRERKSSRNGVHHANGVVWGPV
jgi:hypothetical protein